MRRADGKARPSSVVFAMVVVMTAAATVVNVIDGEWFRVAYYGTLTAYGNWLLHNSVTGRYDQ